MPEHEAIPPVVIGITGMIASGKSYISGVFAEYGAAVQDSDKIAHEILDNEAFAQVSGLFPEAINGGKVNRKVLGELVFADSKKLVQLEGIIHPLVRKRNLEFIKANQDKKIIILEIPLLFESKAETYCNYTIFVNVSRETLEKRALQRPNMSKEKLEKILARQLSAEEKARRADFVIDNNDGDDILLQIEAIINKVKA
ncbi:MAG: dephospho-CoA kinase [Alphaproteobacteria bacterium CG11_big_fil_rev_8_21_14_0_20_44_7]|nr:MAG: dephospho-CoA kinase [Alphaproteobacteria bacterium CG11_big_fil_rev_8_21_14_0_20_44_7]